MVNTGVNWNLTYRRGINGSPTYSGEGITPAGAVGSNESVREVTLLHTMSGVSQPIELPLPENTHIEHIVVKITTPFNGSNNVLIMGDATVDDRFIDATTNIELDIADEIHIFKHHKYADVTQLTTKVTTDGNAGVVEVIVFYGISAE